MGNCTSTSSSPSSNRHHEHTIVQEIPLTSTEQVERLRNLDIFVLDNSIRETTVGQMRGHILQNKIDILEAIQNTGLRHVIIATFNSLKSVDDEFAKIYTKHASSHLNFYCFSEIYQTSTNGVPELNIPIGLEKMELYEIPNIIFEVDVGDKYINREKFPDNDFIDLVVSRIAYVREHINPNSIIFLNIRDLPILWPDANHRERLYQLIKRLAQLEVKIKGLLYEVPGAELFPWEYRVMTQSLRTWMDNFKWSDGHLLIHVHKGYGLGEASVLESMMYGCTGIWCAVCEEGGISGHCCSLMTLTNLARLDNRHVITKYNLAELRRAAIDVTKIVTEKDPAERQEVYGLDAFDILTESMAPNLETDIASIYFKVERAPRFSTLISETMIKERLNATFGEMRWDSGIVKQMKVRVFEDLNQGLKLNYQTSIGLLELYERANGTQHVEDMVKTVLVDKAVITASEHPLVDFLREEFIKSALSMDDSNSGRCTPNQTPSIALDDFYPNFLSKYAPNLTPHVIQKVLATFDSDGSGDICWEEVEVRIRWALAEFPSERETWTPSSLIQRAFQNFVDSAFLSKPKVFSRKFARLIRANATRKIVCLDDDVDN